MHRLALIALTLALGACSSGPGLPQARWEPVAAPTGASLRGLAATADGTVLLGGAENTVLASEDGGRHWRDVSPTRQAVSDLAGAPALDFRDVEIATDARWWAMSAGPGASSTLWVSEDHGVSWTNTFTMPEAQGFLDGIATRPAGGLIAYGDPVNATMDVLLHDAPTSWTRVPPDRLPRSRHGEAGFAASGTGVAAFGTDHLWVATGGAGVANVLRSEDGGRTWTAVATPLADAAASSGIFSLAFVDERHGVIVGGDYQRPEGRDATAAWTDDGGRTWHPPTGASPTGFRSAVAHVPGSTRHLVTVGTNGGDWSDDGGHSWNRLEGPGFHALVLTTPATERRRNPSLDPALQQLGWAAGSDGRVARLVVPR